MEIKEKEPIIYILCGKARHGKDTVAIMIKDYYELNKQKALIISYADYIKTYAKKISDWDGSDDNKPRELLQVLGTDIIRKKIDDLFFVSRICEDIKVYSFFFDAIIISDARYPIEIDIPKNNFENVKAILVTRPNFNNNLSDKEKQHLSEISLDDYQNYDDEIINDSTLEQLKSKVITLMEVTNEY